MESKPIRVLLVDDHTVVRRGMRTLLTTYQTIEVVGEAANGIEAVVLVEAMQPNVVLMDLQMPEMDGIEATRRVRAQHPETQVIVLTSHQDDAHILPAIKAGALSYISKDVEPDELAAAILASRNGTPVLHPEVAARLLHALKRGRTSRLDVLTEREREVLAGIARGLTNAVVAQQLGITERTVAAHVSSMLAKLHLQDRAQAAVFALRERLVPLDDNPT